MATGETVLELVIRCDSQATAEYLLEEIKRLVFDDLGDSLDTYGIFPASVFDAPELPEPAVLSV